MLVGSVAKGTYLSEPDIDVFILFSPSYSREEMEKYGLEIAGAVMPGGMAKYAEHPYLHGIIDGIDVDIVPCYRIDDPERKISAVDRTPFHTEYVRNNISEGQRDEVRLLKAFMKGIGVYGAEAKVGGFSGYLCELLIIKYGTFRDAIRNIANWKRRVHLHLGNGGARFSAPVVFIDPVDSKRNVASAVSEESKAKAILAAKEFIFSPDTRFFFPPQMEPMGYESIKEEFKRRGTTLLCVRFPKPDLIDDVLYPQMKRTLRAFMNILSEFMPVHGDAYTYENMVIFIMEFERAVLPAVVRHEGPPVWTENALEFLKRWSNEAWSGPYIVGNRLYVDRERRHRDIVSHLTHELAHYSLGKYFEKHKDEMQFELGEKCFELPNKILTQFLKRKITWKW